MNLFHFVLFLVVQHCMAEENIATRAVCCASSEESSLFSCENAIDGIGKDIQHGAHSWSSNKQGVGAWLLLHFDGTYLIHKISLMNRWYRREKNKDVTFQFGDGSSQSVTIPYRNGMNGYDWDEFTLVPVASQWVKIMVTAVHSNNNNGWTEVQVYGDGPYRFLSYPSVLPLSVFAGTSAGLLRHRKCASDCVRYPNCLVASMDIRDGTCRLISNECIVTKLEMDGSYVFWKPEGE